MTKSKKKPAKLGRPKKLVKNPIEKAIEKLTKNAELYSTYYPIDHYNVVDYETHYIDGKTTGATIKAIDMNELVKQFIDDNASDINAYTVDRILRSSKLREPNRWSAKVRSGYYDDAYIDGITPSQDIIDGLIETLNKVNDQSDIEKVKLCLIQEYGYLLPQLKSMNTAAIIEVPIDNVKMEADSYMRRLEKEFVDQYDEFDLPRGVVVSCGKDQYRLLDGYHRLSSAHNQKLKKVKVIEISEK